MTASFVVTGTDTGIGKTVFAAALTGALGADYWKPVQAGLDEPTDSETVAALSGADATRIHAEAYRLRTPASPHFAAARDDVMIDVETLTPPATDRPLVIEGAGGLLVPLDAHYLFADLFARWRLPLIVVARTSLGTINHSLLTIRAARAQRLTVHGVAFVGDAVPDSEETICRIGEVRRLGRLPHVEPLDTESLAAAFAANFDRDDFR